MERRGPIGQFPAGFHFVPTDAELICHYLQAKLDGDDLSYEAFIDVKLYDYHPADLVEKYIDCGEGRWFFFTARDRKYPNGLRPNRTTCDGDGYWKATGTEKRIYHNRKLVGIRRSLVFYTGKAGSGQKTDWIMQEYTNKSRSQKSHHKSDSSMQLDRWVLCSIQKKRGADKRKRPDSDRVGRSRSRSPSPSKVPRTDGGGGCVDSVPNEGGPSYRLASPDCQVEVHQRGWDDLQSICNNQFNPENNAPQYALPFGMQAYGQSATARRLLSADFSSEADKRKRPDSDRVGRSRSRSPSPSKVPRTDGGGGCVDSVPNEGGPSYRLASPDCQVEVHQRGWDDLQSICNNQFNPENNAPQYALPFGMQAYGQSATARRLLSADFSSEAASSSLQFYSTEAMNSGKQVSASEVANSSLRFLSAEAINSGLQVCPSEAANSSLRFFSAEAMNSRKQLYPSEATNSSVQFYSAEAMDSAQQVCPTMRSEQKFYPEMSSAQPFFLPPPPMNSAQQVYPSIPPMSSAEQVYPSLMAVNYAEQVYYSGTSMISAEQVYPSLPAITSAEQVSSSLPAMTSGEQVYPSGTPMNSAEHVHQSAALTNWAQQVLPLVHTSVKGNQPSNHSSVQDNPSDSACSQAKQNPPNSASQGDSSEPTNTDLPLELLDFPDWLMQDDSNFFDGLPLELWDDQPQFLNLSEQDGGSQLALPGHGGSGLPPPTSDMPPNNDSKLQTGRHHHAQYQPQISTLVH